MIINVTQEHINRGVRGECTVCPVALAIHEQTKFKQARVSGYNWRTGEPRSVYVPIDSRVTDFVANFDAHRAVEPFSFELNLETA